MILSLKSLLTPERREERICLLTNSLFFLSPIDVKSLFVTLLSESHILALSNDFVNIEFYASWINYFTVFLVFLHNIPVS